MSDLTLKIWRSPFGWIGLASGSRGLAAITSPRRSRREAFVALQSIVGRAGVEGDDDHIRLAQKQLDFYFRRDPDADLAAITIDLRRGTTFERRVWRQLRKIPRGQTRTYSELARSVGHPLAARAVGQCNAKNPWAIVVPCHRVLGKNAGLTGYAGGIEMKRRLLELEGISLTAHRAKLLAAAPRRKRAHADRY